MKKPVWIGLLVGVLAGYPISYFFQSGALRAKMSLGDYITKIDDIFGSKDLAPTAIGTWIACVILCPVIAILIGQLLTSKK